VLALPAGTGLVGQVSGRRRDPSRHRDAKSIVQVTNLGISVRYRLTGVRHAARHGAAVAGATVTIRNIDNTQLWRGTGADGVSSRLPCRANTRSLPMI
jgi:hypothetical protein